MDTLTELRAKLHQAKKPLASLKSYYKTGPGGYAEHDQFIGVNVPDLRKIAKLYGALSLKLIQELIESPINEERFLALLILINRYQQEQDQGKQTIYQFYLHNLSYINNWNLVDVSAPWIMGAYLLNADKAILLRLAESTSLWERRVAIVSTWYFIREKQFASTMQIASILLFDSHDLIHKAVGWMLREVGKRDQQVLIDFLERNAYQMPRTMLRYAIEKFSSSTRQLYLSAKAPWAHP